MNTCHKFTQIYVENHFNREKNYELLILFCINFCLNHSNFIGNKKLFSLKYILKEWLPEPRKICGGGKDEDRIFNIVGKLLDMNSVFSGIVKQL